MIARRSVFALLLLALPALAASGAPELAGVGFDQHPGVQLPLDARLIDERGAELTLESLTGDSPLIVVFSYYRCPNLCTLVLNGLAQALEKLPDRLGTDYRVISLSIDPLERPALALAKKRSYLARLGFGDEGAPAAGWRFLLGA
jgi:protein SCO1/2